MASRNISIQVRDIPGMAAFFDAVSALLDTVNTAQVPREVGAAADRVRAEALGIGDGEMVISAGDEERTPGQVANEVRLRTAMQVAKENPLRAVTVDWIREF